MKRLALFIIIFLSSSSLWSVSAFFEKNSDKNYLRSLEESTKQRFGNNIKEKDVPYFELLLCMKKNQDIEPVLNKYKEKINPLKTYAGTNLIHSSIIYRNLSLLHFILSVYNLDKKSIEVKHNNEYEEKFFDKTPIELAYFLNDKKILKLLVNYKNAINAFSNGLFEDNKTSIPNEIVLYIASFISL